MLWANTLRQPTQDPDPQWYSKLVADVSHSHILLFSSSSSRDPKQCQNFDQYVEQ